MCIIQVCLLALILYIVYIFYIYVIEPVVYWKASQYEHKRIGKRLKVSHEGWCDC